MNSGQALWAVVAFSLGNFGYAWIAGGSYESAFERSYFQAIAVALIYYAYGV